MYFTNLHCYALIWEMIREAKILYMSNLNIIDERIAIE